MQIKSHGLRLKIPQSHWLQLRTCCCLEKRIENSSKFFHSSFYYILIFSILFPCTENYHATCQAFPEFFKNLLKHAILGLKALKKEIILLATYSHKCEHWDQWFQCIWCADNIPINKYMKNFWEVDNIIKNKGSSHLNLWCKNSSRFSKQNVLLNSS